jgi:MYXO-CTERM domain-containing protein
MRVSRLPAPSSLASVLALAGCSLFADVHDAHACGGCFSAPPPRQVDTSVVTDHRMAFSLSPSQTVLWDQIRYTGNPSEFAWVLPVKQGARIELSQDAWIASLDASTATVIQGPAPNCPRASGSSGVGCSSSNSAGFAESAGGPGGVQVVSESVVGPYDAVTVRASQGEALGDWLRTNGFDVPIAIQPTIDAYTAEGFDFIALKLRPGEGIQAMQPVRVVTPGADPSLPLRMVAAGVGPNVGLLLFLLSEGRYHPQNFPDATIDFSQLTWDGANSISNYEPLAKAAMAAKGGTSWLTESAAPVDLGYGYYSGASNDPSLPMAYASACTTLTLPPPSGCGVSDAGGEASLLNGDATPAEDAQGGDGESEAGDDASLASDVATSETDAAADSGGALPEASTMFTDAGTCSSTMVPCDDYDLAMSGVAQGTLWVTRLRALLPASALSADLVLEATQSQAQVPSFHVTSTYSDPSYNACPNSGPGCDCRTSESPRTPLPDAFLLGLGAAIVGLSFRRRRR